MEDITDIQGVINYFVERDQIHQKQLISMSKKIEYLQDKLSLSEQENKKLRDKLSVLSPTVDSHNSNLPPSKDPLNKKRSLRKSSGLPPGGQAGHKGTTLQMREKADRDVFISPGYCRYCGHDLSSISGRIVERSQEIDIPAVIPVCTQYQLVEKKCSCGRENKADFPFGVTHGVSYGKGVESLITYLNVCQHIPVARLATLLKEVFNIPISSGTINNVLLRMQKRTLDAYETIRKQITRSRVVGADETSMNVNGKTLWGWVWQSPTYTYITAGRSRKKQVFSDVMPQGLPKAVLVTDCLPSYFSEHVYGHQICTAHILRELVYLSELYNHSWSNKMTKLILKALDLRKRLTGKIDSSRIKKRLDKLLSIQFGNGYRKIVSLQKRLLKYREYLFYFLENEDVPPDNNASERAIRAFKVKCKVSGFFKSTHGAQRFAQLHSIADTARKNGMSPFNAFNKATDIG